MEKGYNLKDAANLLGVKVRTIRQWIHDGKINATKIPMTRRWLVMESEIRRMQNGNKD
jgi:excisionase family DNA binding protein